MKVRNTRIPEIRSGFWLAVAAALTAAFLSCKDSNTITGTRQEATPTHAPTAAPTAAQTPAPTAEPTAAPTAAPTTTPAPAPTPTAAPKPVPTGSPRPADISGTWTGTFNSFDFLECDQNVPAQAVFTQHDFAVDGTLEAAANGCGNSRVVVHARLTAIGFYGSIVSSGTPYHFSPGSTVRGTFSGSVLTVTLHDSHYQYIPGGTMTLHR